MKLLAVFCHPMQDSFTGQILNNFVRGAEEAGHSVEIADLYREDFQPIMQEGDFVQFYDKPMPEDVLKEQERFERCDAFVLVFPIWWWSFPAMLKGWIERVFTAGWAFTITDDPEGSMLDERRALVLCCAGGSAAMFEKYGARESLTNMIEVGVMEYCGVTDVHTHIFHRVRTSVEIPDEVQKIRAKHLEEALILGREYF